jgi:hypothetical protein
MTGTEFKLALHALGLSQVRIGKLLCADPRTARRWAAVGPPVPVGIIVRFLLQVRSEKGAEEAVKQIEALSAAATAPRA